MLASLALAASLSVAMQVAAPIPTASAGPLKEIGRVRATTPLCTSLVTRAVKAIDLETQFDVRLRDAEYALGVVDLDSSPLAKMHGASDTRARYVELAANIATSRKEMKTFGRELEAAPTPEARTALQRFADALDGALHHQQTLADELGRFLAYVETHDPIDANAHDAMRTEAIADANNSRTPRAAYDPRDFGPTAGLPPSLSTVAKSAAILLANRSAPLEQDERQAADRIESAFSGC